MHKYPLQNSNIEIQEINGIQCITVPHGSAVFARFFQGVFLLLWFILWFILCFVFFEKFILDNDKALWSILAYGMWIFLGVGIVVKIFCIFRKVLPEKLLLNKLSMSFDTGTPVYKMYYIDYYTYNYKCRIMFPKSKKIEFTYEDLKNIYLLESAYGNKLIIFKGSKLINIAEWATDIERKWLFKYLQKKYP